MTPLKYILLLITYFKKDFLLIIFYPFIKAVSLIFPSYIIRTITQLINEYGITKDKFVGKYILLNILFYLLVNNIFFFLFYIYKKYIYPRFFSLIRKKIIDRSTEKLLYSSKIFMQKHGSSEIAHFLIHLHENVIDFLNLLIEKTLSAFISLIAIITILYYYNFLCSIVLCIWFFFILCLSGYILKNRDKYSISIIDEKVGITKYIIDILNNIMTIQIFSKYDKEKTLLQLKTKQLSQYELENSQYYAKIDLFYFLSFTAMEIISHIILYVQYYTNCIQTSDLILWWTITGTAYFVAQSFIYDIINIPKYYYGIQEALIIIEQKNKIKTQKSFIYNEGIIELKNVVFKHHEKTIINNVSLTLKKGNKIGIVGFSGGGKSSLIYLILGIYKPTSGTIYIDEQNINEININNFYQKCSVIFQNNNIFNRSIMQNITYYDDIVNEKKYKKIMTDLGISYLIDQNIDIENLSGGEKQRINIGRALYKDNSEFYIFDEPTSNLDSITEQIIIKKINNISPNKTIIMITHKLSLIKDFDKIFVFDKGEIVQNGTHTELLSVNGLYKTLWDLKEIN